MKNSIKYISIILLGLILVNSFSLTLVKVHYELNKEFIIENYCINIDKPSLECEGQCHLKETIENITKESSPTEENSSNIRILSVEYFLTSSVSFSYIEEPSLKHNSIYLNNYTFLASTPIEKPPFS